MTEINNCPINPVELKTTQFMHTAIDPTNVKGKIWSSNCFYGKKFHSYDSL
mgnify:CR=1 FL=1